MLKIKMILLSSTFILLCGCAKCLNFTEVDELKYVNENKDNVTDFIVETNTLLGRHCYQINKQIGIEELNKIEIKEEADITVTDSDMYYKVVFNDGEIKTFDFEGNNFVYNDKKYELKDSIYVFVLSEENEIECK